MVVWLIWAPKRMEFSEVAYWQSYGIACWITFEGPVLLMPLAIRNSSMGSTHSKFREDQCQNPFPVCFA